ncbi:MAG: spore cortex biosynthesis protein YabQ [Paenibacillus sp.]|nr:spore cortex biosynthesis protein YabQ [Paenibacillus sp.]
MGAIFDAYRVLSSQLRVPRWMIPLLDIVYWIVSTVLVFRGLYASNHGQVRLYVFLGLIAGGWVYMGVMSHTFIRLLEWLIRIVKKIFRLLIQTVKILVIKPIVVLYKLVIVIFGFLLALTVFLYKIVLQLLYPFWFVFRSLFRLVQPWLKALRPQWAEVGWLKLVKLWNRMMKKS